MNFQDNKSKVDQSSSLQMTTYDYLIVLVQRMKYIYSSIFARSRRSSSAEQLLSECMAACHDTAWISNGGRDLADHLRGIISAERITRLPISNSAVVVWTRVDWPTGQFLRSLISSRRLLAHPEVFVLAGETVLTGNRIHRLHADAFKTKELVGPPLFTGAQIENLFRETIL